MKAIRPFLVFLVFVAIAGAILSLMVPVYQEVQKTISIKAPAAAVYAQIAKLENFNHWSVWGRQDSSAIYTINGIDGTVGASTSWKGDPSLSGQGIIEITALEKDRSISHGFRFISPKKASATSRFSIQEVNGLSAVTWLFRMATPRPWNIFNMFYNMEKEMGKDFEQGLDALKEILESQANTAPGESYKMNTMNFPPSALFNMFRIQNLFYEILLPVFMHSHQPCGFCAKSQAESV